VTLKEYASNNPEALVLLTFKNDGGMTGSLVITAGRALAPNASMRYFPPGNVQPADLAWGAPWWYADEVTAWKPYLPDYPH